MTLRHPFPATTELAKDLRKRSTKAEDVLWQALRNRNLQGYKFRRQAPIGRFIVDFLCVKPSLIIEVDGKIHENQIQEDQERTEAILHDVRIPLLRLTNEEVLENLPITLQKITNALVAEEKSNPDKKHFTTAIK